MTFNAKPTDGSIKIKKHCSKTTCAKFIVHQSREQNQSVAERSFWIYSFNSLNSFKIIAISTVSFSEQCVWISTHSTLKHTLDVDWFVFTNQLKFQSHFIGNAEAKAENTCARAQAPSKMTLSRANSMQINIKKTSLRPKAYILKNSDEKKNVQSIFNTNFENIQFPHRPITMCAQFNQPFRCTEK